MYEPINSEDSQKATLNTNAEREQFVNELLDTYLSREKIKEKEKLCESIKFKRHQIDEVVTRRAKKGKTQSALASGVSLQSSHNYKQIKELKINAKARKELKIYKVDGKEKIDYEKYKQANQLWKAYAISCLLDGLKPSNNETTTSLNKDHILNTLKQIDYHGCHLTVAKSICKTQVGVRGFVLQERKNVFVLVNEQNEVKYIPKKGTLFEFGLFDESDQIVLCGSNMIYRPDMRQTKHAKIKTKTDIY